MRGQLHNHIQEEVRNGQQHPICRTHHLGRQYPPDDDKFAALREFKQPANVKELRSFLGLVAQFGAFAPDTACLTSHLRQLLQKETPWVWLPEHKLDFENTKKALTSPTMLQPLSLIHI